MTFDSYIVVLRNVSIKKVTNQTVRGLKQHTAKHCQLNNKTKITNMEKEQDFFSNLTPTSGGLILVALGALVLIGLFADGNGYLT